MEFNLDYTTDRGKGRAYLLENLRHREYIEWRLRHPKHREATPANRDGAGKTVLAKDKLILGHPVDS